MVATYQADLLDVVTAVNKVESGPLAGAERAEDDVAGEWPAAK